MTHEKKGADYLDRLWGAVMDLAKDRGAAPINYVWETHLDDGWILILNGTKTAHEHEGWTVEPYHLSAFRGGWILADFTAFEGTIVSNTIENAEPLIAAIKAAN